MKYTVEEPMNVYVRCEYELLGRDGNTYPKVCHFGPLSLCEALNYVAFVETAGCSGTHTILEEVPHYHRAVPVGEQVLA